MNDAQELFAFRLTRSRIAGEWAMNEEFPSVSLRRQRDRGLFSAHLKHSTDQILVPKAGSVRSTLLPLSVLTLFGRAACWSRPLSAT